eukprot:303917-Hanusia_phi.AAC.2
MSQALRVLIRSQAAKGEALACCIAIDRMAARATKVAVVQCPSGNLVLLISPSNQTGTMVMLAGGATQQ